MIDPVTDTDLTAFVDGQLDVMRSLEVEAHLARHPETAARVMAEIYDRDALRAAYAASPGPGPDRNRQAARRMDRALRWRRVSARLKRAAAIAVLVGAGWLLHDESGRFGVPDTFAATVDPTLVEDARQARSVAELRARLGTQPAARYDRAGIEAATGIALPALPEGWQVRDVQVFPARHGTGVEVLAVAGALGEVALFATHRRTDRLVEVERAEIERADGGATVYWASGGSAYALSGAGDEGALMQAATRLAAAR